MLIKTGSHTHIYIYIFGGVLGFHMVIIYGFILLGKIHWTNITLICLCRGLGHRPVIDRPRIVRFICSMSVCMTIFININYVEPTSTNGRNRSRPKCVSESVLFFGPSSKTRNYVHHLANLCIAFSHLNGSISIAQGAELMEQLAAQAGVRGDYGPK